MMPTLNDPRLKSLLRRAVFGSVLTTAVWGGCAAAEDLPAPSAELPTGKPAVGAEGTAQRANDHYVFDLTPDELRGPVHEEAKRMEFRRRTTIDAVGGAEILLRELPAEPSVPLPPDAQKIFERHQQDQEAARRKFEEQSAEANLAVIRELEAIQQKYVQAGKLEDALAVRRQIQMLQARATQAAGVLVPQAQNVPNLSSFRGQGGRTFTFEVIGSLNGPLWGSGVYTDDSSPAVAAVHAGIVHPGQKALVRVTLTDGLPAFTGSAANGVNSQNYGAWPGAYKIELAPADAKPDAVPPAGNGPGGNALPAAPGGEKVDADAEKPLVDPGTLRHYGDFVGRTFTFEVTGALEGKVWGSGVYTEDSALATAAVHAGALQPGEKGIVHVKILGPQEKYLGTTQNGVISLAYGKVGESAYQIEVPQNSPAALRQQAFQRATAAQLRDLILGANAPGSSFEVEIVGVMEGTVWGDGVYTDDSNLAAAAVHAGVMGEGERGKVKVTLMMGQQNYTAGIRNGVSTQSFGRW